ncbi:hypothetical protein GCM10023093_25460 [Nemorincola caseinilytica]|uniref:BIG2 domain-containing protein n=1 Tax=Nemorincola caseinilytica TaxID=2054315 RepID=A0ABP8NJS0_9BACT
MKKLSILVLGLCALLFSRDASATIHGTLGACVGNTSLLYDSTSSGPSTGGTWSSSNVAVATVSSGGLVTGISAGTTTISYTSTLMVTSTAVFTVNPAPGAISGSTTPFCAGSSITLTCPTAGGVWSSSSGVASVSPTTGVVTGISGGTATIYYSISTGCSSSFVVTVNGVPFVDSLLGASSICVGATGTITCTTAGGAWSSSNTSVATVSGGVVTGVSAGTAIISYLVTGACGTGLRTRTVTITSTTSPGTISGTGTVMVGFTTALSSTVPGGAWSSSNTAIATVSASGVVTGVAPGIATISYGVSGCSGMAYAIFTISVSAADCISGDVLFSGSPYYGMVKVWLIKYNGSTHMLYAVDSLNAYASGTSAHYSFCGIGTDSFRVKAACDSSVLSAPMGYQPTYHTASAYWSAATVVYHVTGTHDMSKNINMNYGATTSGPGFIAGDVTTGANKGTADPIPAVGLLIYCVNNTTGAIMQQTVTNSAGHYSFSNLPVGTYKIYPELMNYATTPYTSITLTSGSSSMTSASFVQHTVSHTITPITSGVQDMKIATGSIAIFPNPTNGVLNISWGVENAGMAEVRLADVTGRSVFATTADLGATAGTTVLNLNGVAKGIYIISIKANGLNYNNKIVVE